MKNILITGGSRGIGREIVKELSSMNEYNVFTTSTSEIGIETIKKINKEINAYILDLHSKESINEFIEKMNAVGGMDIIIHNAGITKDALSIRMSDDDWLNVINVNLNSIFYLNKGLMRNMMQKRWGRIVSITSVVAHTGNKGQINYTAAKGGVISMNKSLALELAARNITVNCISPGFISTDMTEKLSDKHKEQFMQQIPMGRFGNSADISEAVKFLISEKASYITGQTLHINGGLFMN